MDWNSFNKELQNRVSDPGIRYMLGIVYERQLHMAKQVDACSSIVNELANVMGNFVTLHEVLDGRLKDLNKHVRGDVDGVELDSVPITNDDPN
jgi:hypothetical protein